MSWLELDDRILEHPKFVRLFRLVGSEGVHLWLGFKAYCGQNLTDGFVPADMLDEVRGPTNPKRRSAALDALKTVGLLELVEGGLRMHDYLDWSSSREQVLANRKAARERKARSRDPSRRDHPDESRRDSAMNPPAVTPGVTNPHARDPLPTTPHQTNSGGEGSPPHDCTDSDLETVCPLNLVEQARERGVLSQMLEHMPGIVIEQLEDKGREFVGYWTIGAGAGKRRRHWMPKFREELRRAYLDGKLRAPGAIEHEGARGVAPSLEDTRAERARLFQRAELGQFGERAQRTAREFGSASAAPAKFLDALERMSARLRQAASEPRPLADALASSAPPPTVVHLRAVGND